MPYIGKSPHFGVRNRFIYTATGDETSKSGADDSGATLTFTDGAYVDVYLNGVLLKPDTDYVTTTANTIGSLSALSTSDILEVIVYDVFSVSDTVSAASGGAFSGRVDFTGGVGGSGGNLVLKNTDTADDSFPTLTLQTGDTDIAVGDVLGRIAFQAPDEGAGTDAILVPVNIEAVSQGDFSSSNNATSLVINTSTTSAAGTAGDGGKFSFVGNGEFIVKSLATTDGNYPVLTMQTGETDIEEDDIIGQISFQAPDEGTGTDAILVAGAIQAVSEGDFSSSSNATSLVLKTGESAAASERVRINSLGAVKARADGTVTQSDLGDQVHEFAHASNDKDVMRVGVSNTGYAANGFSFGCTRSSSNAYSTISAHHGNDGSDRYADRTFTVTGQGEIASDHSQTVTSGADYAEYFEWKDGNSSSEDRIGQSVVLDGNKIRKATSDDSASNILGVISGNPSVVGDTAGLRWQGKWELDDFNRRQTEEVEVWEWKDDDGAIHSYRKDKVPEGLTVPSDKTVKKVINDKYSSSYDVSKKDDYVPRKDRKEWDAVGLMGKLRMLKGQPTGDRWIKMRDISDTVEEWLVR